MGRIEPATYTNAEDWIEWLKSLDPITAIRVGSTLTDGSTTRRLAAIIDEITYKQTTAGSGPMTQTELADAIGVTRSSVARRAGRYRSAIRNPTTWTAVLAPIGVETPDGRYLDPDCVITLADTGAPLYGHSRTVIGRVARVSIVDGYLTASGTMDIGLSVPVGLPTMDLYPSVASWDEEATRMTFTAGTIRAVRVGYAPAWGDPRIQFSG